MYSLEDKLKKQIKKSLDAKICFFDVDGTLFTPDLRIFLARLYDTQTYALLQKNDIPFVVVTGRFYWHTLRNIELAFYGLPNPDVIIFAGGSEILLRKNDGTYQKDTSWLHNAVHFEAPSNIVIPLFKRINEYAYASSINHLPTVRLQKVVKALEKKYQQHASIFYSESLIRNNSLKIFSGSLFVSARGANKGGSVKHILNFCKTVTKKTRTTAFIFGDGSIDIPMLSLPSTNSQTIKSYLVHPAPLAREKAKRYKSITIIERQGPQTILAIMKTALPRPLAFSPAQNNPLRKLVRLFEPLLDRLTDQSLSANDISLSGINQVITGIKLINSVNPFFKIKGLYLYLFGNLTDVLDGIRARRKGKESKGQLVDGFADRVKEFYQLYQRATTILDNARRSGYIGAGTHAAKNLPSKENHINITVETPALLQDSRIIQTFLSALSCSLPSIARAQVETQNIIVKERDREGGSMIDRTKLLFISMLFQFLNMRNKSFQIDKELYKRNIATFKNRLSVVPNFSLEKIKKERLNHFQQEALERWLLYVEIFQDENKVITETLKKYPTLQKEFVQQTKDYSFYLNLPINKIRREKKIEPFIFSLGFILNGLV